MRFQPTGLVAVLAVLAISRIGLADPATPPKAPAAKPAAEVHEVKPKFGDYLAARAAQLDHDWRPAAELTRQAWEADKDDPGLRHDALLLSVAGGDFAGALEVAHAIPADGSDADLAGFIITLDDIAAGRYAVASSKLASASHNGLNHYLMPLMSAWVAVGEGKKDVALAALAMLDDQPGEVATAIELQRAQILDSLGDHAASGDIYAKLLDGTPSVRAVVAAAYFYERQGAADKARAAIEKLDANGAQSSLRIEMLTRASDKGRAPPVLDAKSGAAGVLLEVAAALGGQKQVDIAPLLYTQFALHLRPDFPSAQLLLAQVDERFGRLDDAATALLAVDEKSDLRSTAERLAIAALERSNQSDKALKLAQTAVKAYPQDIDLALFGADLLRQKQHYPEAIKAYGEVLTRIPGTSDRKGLALFHRGMAYQEAHQWPAAEADLLAALQLRPDDPAVLNYLGFSWADQGVNLDRARTMIERALSLVPDDGAIVDSLGWVMFRSGDYDDAVKQLERAVSLNANDATINDHLGDAYWRAGRQIEARSQWEKAARFSDDKDLSEQIKVKLRDGLPADNPPKHAEAN